MEEIPDSEDICKKVMDFARAIKELVGKTAVNVLLREIKHPDSVTKIQPSCDILINVPGRRTAFVQELHLPVYHALCLIVENSFFGNQDC